MEESPVWAYDVKRKNGIASVAVMTNGVVTVPFIRRNGDIVGLSHGRMRIDGASASNQEDLEMPPAHYSIACKMAAAILREQRPRRALER